MKFDKNYFIKQEFSQNELNKYKKAAERDLSIAHKDKEIEVIFHFSYMALLKIGIYVIAKEGYRVKSRRELGSGLNYQQNGPDKLSSFRVIIANFKDIVRKYNLTYCYTNDNIMAGG